MDFRFFKFLTFFFLSFLSSFSQGQTSLVDDAISQVEEVSLKELDLSRVSNSSKI
jgi:hypothetical protein